MARLTEAHLSEIKKLEMGCLHEWEAMSGWGVIVGISRCKRCGKLSEKRDFTESGRAALEEE